MAFLAAQLVLMGLPFNCAPKRKGEKCKINLTIETTERFPLSRWGSGCVLSDENYFLLGLVDQSFQPVPK